MDPKYLIISGGEAALIPHFDRYLHLLKDKIDPFIRLITNGTDINRLIKLLPFVDIVSISFDGLGVINKKQRGVDGEIILKKSCCVVKRNREKRV